MDDTTRQSEQIMQAANTSLQVQRDGGFHRPGDSIGRGSARLKWKHRLKKIRNIAIGVGALWIGASVVGTVIGGLGFGGVMAVGIATLATLYVLGKFPRMKVPKVGDIMKGGDIKALVARTELWLEHQRGILPKTAQSLIDKIGSQLDTLGVQLEGLDQNHPTAREIRKLVGEHLPEMVESYRKIPAHLRGEIRAGDQAPDQQLTGSLSKISDEIDSITRQLAEGTLDDLAIKGRYLDYKYGAGPEGDSGVPLPDFNLEKSKNIV